MTEMQKTGLCKTDLDKIVTVIEKSLGVYWRVPIVVSRRNGQLEVRSIYSGTIPNLLHYALFINCSYYQIGNYPYDSFSEPLYRFLIKKFKIDDPEYPNG